MALTPSPENFRAELARRYIQQRDVGALIGMHPDQLSRYVSGKKALPGWAAHNIGWGINRLARARLFEVDDSLGVVPAPARGRPPGYTNPDTMDPMRKKIAG